MFAVYKKIISPDTSPVLGPASPNLTPMMNANNNANNNVNTNNLKETGTNTNNLKETGTNTNNLKETGTNNTNAITNASAMESLSLCNYCCSPRNKLKKDDAPAPAVQHPEQRTYEFGHATHYVYGVTTPRLLCDFETGTPPSP
jgi:hypothetical protein